MPDQHDIIHAVASQFHRNFSDGAFEKNGDLVTEDIQVNSNTVAFRGRDAFVERLRRYETAFPGLQLRDQVVVVDGRSAAVQYVLQGRHNGPFGDLEATGRLIEIYSGEVFDFDDQGKMERLLTITRLHHVRPQLVGSNEIREHQTIGLNHPSDESPLPLDAQELYAFLAAGRFDRIREIAHQQVKTSVHSHDDPGGLDAFVHVWEKMRAAFPDAVVSVERTLRDGEWMAVVYSLTGTHSGPFDDFEGRTHEATGMPVALRGIDFLRVTRGRLTELIAIHDGDDVVSQITPRAS